MYKKTAIILAFFVIVSLAYKTAYCMSVNLTAGQINEAIKYGQTNRLANPKEFSAPLGFSPL